MDWQNTTSPDALLRLRKWQRLANSAHVEKLPHNMNAKEGESVAKSRVSDEKGTGCENILEIWV